MRDLAGSLIGFTWAGSLLALRGAADLAAAAGGGGDGEDSASRGRSLFETRFDRVTWEVVRQLPDAAVDAFRVGDSLQRDAIDRWLPDPAWTPAGWLRAATAAGETTGRSARFFAPTAEGCSAWRELLDKLEVYRLVRGVAERIGVPAPGEPFDLETLVGRAYALDDFAALWAVEGLGHDDAEHVWPDGGPDPEGLLTGERAAALPAKSLLMLHAGIGLAFAQRLLAELPPDAPADRVRGAVAEVLELCRSNSRPGLEGAALESLGLVTRTFHGDRVGAVDAALRTLDDEAARGFFWHGVGRALYFLPINFLPAGDATWRPFEMGLAEAPDPFARRNVLAGLAWAFTLVNMRRPELMTGLLLARHGARLEREAGFSNGVSSSVVMRSDTTPGSPLIRTFLDHRPPADTAARWDALVVGPARRALDEVYPRLRREGRLGEIFRAGADGGRTGGPSP